MAYKVFQNGFPLPASDINNYLMNQSVMVFANNSARSGSLPTPTEGMVTYLEDTNKVEVYTGSAWVDINDNTNAILRSTVTATGDLIVGNGNASVTRLGIGGNGAVLLSNGTTATWLALGANNTVLTSNGTTATWSTPSSAGEVLISSTALSGSVTTLSSIPGTYQHLRVLVKQAQITGTVDWRPSISINGATSTALISSDKVDVSDGSNFSYMGELLFYTSTSNFKSITGRVGFETDASTNYAFASAGVNSIETTSAITSIALSTDQGTFNAGTIELWGVR